MSSKRVQREERNRLATVYETQENEDLIESSDDGEDESSETRGLLASTFKISPNVPKVVITMPGAGHSSARSANLQSPSVYESYDSLGLHLDVPVQAERFCRDHFSGDVEYSTVSDQDPDFDSEMGDKNWKGEQPTSWRELELHPRQKNSEQQVFSDDMKKTLRMLKAWITDPQPQELYYDRSEENLIEALQVAVNTLSFWWEELADRDEVERSVRQHIKMYRDGRQ